MTHWLDQQLHRAHGRQWAAVAAALFTLLPGVFGAIANPTNDSDRSDWWSLKPLVRPSVPASTLQRFNASTNPIDAFVVARLDGKGFRPSPEADRRTLIRRLSFDLIGLPPTPEEIEAFIADKDPRAYEKLVDRLLASPQHGERWARHWLDVVHFGETHGYDKDKPRPNAWPYRDYVIRAFNEDKPYARFVQEQVAGDVLFPGTRDGIEALGFIAAGPWDLIGHEEVPESKVDGKIARHLDRDDMVANTIQTFNSLTVQCAQCHNHKFDPIPQEDYYSLQAVFAALDRTDKRYDTDPAVAKKRAALEAEQAEKELLQSFAKTLSGLKQELSNLPPQSVAYVGAVHTGSGSFAGTGAKGGAPRPIHVLNRGNVQTPGKEVGPGALSCVAGLPSRFTLHASHSEGDRRAALAHWLTSTNNPLTWRSIVNRVWQYHFGRGLVETPNDFGRMGSPPSHPELLDWLACEFRDGGQSLKSLHRLIVTSAIYRQSSGVEAESREGAPTDERFNASTLQRFGDPAASDPDNRLLWRQNRRKLEAEAVRDAVLFVSGKLDMRMGGPGFQDFVIDKPEHSPHYEYHLHDPEDPKSHRRSIYRFIVRSQPQPFMTTLDCADPSMQVGRRNESVSPLQALTLLNNALMVTMPRHFASKLERAEAILPDQVRRAHYEALGRPPTAEEEDALTAYARQHGLANLCRVLFNLNEFTFID